MAWVAPVISAVGSIAGGMLSGGGDSSINKAGDQIWKPFRQPIIDAGMQINDLLKANPSGLNDMMKAGIAGMFNMGNTLQPFINYGNSMMGAGGAAAGGALGAAQNLMGFNPAAFMQTFNAGNATGGTYDTGTYDTIMGRAQSAINPMLDQIAAMNARAFNEQGLPGIADQATMAGQMGGGGKDPNGGKWGINNAVLGRGVADANSNAAAQLYGGAHQQAAGIGGQYGLSNMDAFNRMAMLNTQLGNTLNFQQANNFADMSLRGMMEGGNLMGQMANLGASYFTPTAQLASSIPEYQLRAGSTQLNAPMDWLTKGMNALLAGGSGSSAPNNYAPQASPWGAVMGQLADAGIQWYENSKTT